MNLERLRELIERERRQRESGLDRSPDRQAAHELDQALRSLAPLFAELWEAAKKQNMKSMRTARALTALEEA